MQYWLSFGKFDSFNHLIIIWKGDKISPLLTDFCVLHTGVFVNDIHVLPTLGILYNTTLSCYHSSLDKHVNHGPGPGFVFECVPP